MFEIGDVVAMPLPLGGYGAAQVTGAADDVITVCLLRWHSEALPALDDLRDAGPLTIDHHAWRGDPEVVNIDVADPVPTDFVLIGRLPIGPDLPRETICQGFWPGLPEEVTLQRRWETVIPAEARAAYKNAVGGRVRVDLGGSPMYRSGHMTKLDLRERRGEIRWAGLDVLPCLTGLMWSGSDRGLIEALEARPMISSLHWSDPPDEVDLGRTHLTELTFSGSGPRRAVLPPEVLHLRLDGELPERVTANSDGRWVRLGSVCGVPRGLAEVRKVFLDVAGDLVLATLDELVELEFLYVRWRKRHGGLVGRVASPRLDRLELVNAYGVDASMLPESLRVLSVSGLRSSQVEPIRQRYRGSGTDVEVYGAKSDKWLAVNLDNPLRDWVDDHKRAGTEACKAYVVAAEAIGRLTPDDPGAVADARETLRDFVQELNSIDERYGMIDALRRKEAGDAFGELAKRAGVPAAEAASWFDDWREF
ncbi:hypothetical protein ABZ897_52605 [Nonomuraea sp. NPDC046802]|uniref:hypothetical protein n=1 Tax=Nonomuraea sp. NPDC046802 TaxID=3154919 RepID=UPI0033C0D577